jgi:hypothetical protein
MPCARGSGQWVSLNQRICVFIPVMPVSVGHHHFVKARYIFTACILEKKRQESMKQASESG